MSSMRHCNRVSRPHGGHSKSGGLHSIDQRLEAGVVEDLELARHAAIARSARRDESELYVCGIELLLHDLAEDPEREKRRVMEREVLVSDSAPCGTFPGARPEHPQSRFQ